MAQWEPSKRTTHELQLMNYKTDWTLQTQLFAPDPEKKTLALEMTWTYNDGEDVLRTGLVVQPLSSVDGALDGVDAKQTHTTGVYGALQRVGQPVMLITI